MPRAMLEFSLPEEREEFETAMQAGAYYSVLWDLGTWLRNIVKYEPAEKQFLTADAVRTKLHELLSDREISL